MYTLTLLKSFGFFMIASWTQNILSLQLLQFSDKIYILLQLLYYNIAM
jgi:hypothetical protein